MSSRELTMLQSLKIHLLCSGVAVSPTAEAELTRGGVVPMSVHEYPTTGGLTIAFENNVYVNAPLSGPLAEAPEATLNFNKTEKVPFYVMFRGREFPARVLPLPGYLYDRDSLGRLVTDAVFSHADRARLSPIGGCHNNCVFCDSPLKTYELRPVEQLLESLSVAQADNLLPTQHVLISGGTPSPNDYDYFSQACEAVIRNAGMPVDVMMAPRHDTKLIDQLFEWGVYGYAINLEIFDEETAKCIAPQKRRLSLRAFEQNIERAVQRTGGNGRVRSLLLVGLESEERTLRGVEFLSRLGCDPVLSPFRPAPGTALANHPSPPYEVLESVYLKSLEIVERYRVKLGPRCIPCTHNTLTFADSTDAYYFS